MRIVTLVALIFAAPLNAKPAPRWIVVTAPAFRKAVEPLVAHRKAEGFDAVVVETTSLLSKGEILRGDATKLRDLVHTLAKGRDECYVLLVGAVSPGSLPEPEKRVVPTMRGTISRMKNQPTDAPFGCLDKSRLPTVPVGRFPARNVDDVKAMVSKTLALEKNEPGRWKRDITILAGMPAFNPLVDRLVVNLAMQRVGRIAPVWSGRAIFHNPSSRFTLPDPLLRQKSLDMIAKGQAFVFYLGHSNARAFYAGRARYLDRDDWARLKIPTGGSIFITFGCNGCQLGGFDGEGYGVHAMRNPNGPVGVIGSHAICFAAMVELASNSLFANVFRNEPPERLGACWLACLQGVAKGKIGSFTFGMLDRVDGDPTIPQATQRQEHLEMFVLLGDPALKLPKFDADLELDVPEKVKPGGKLVIRGQVPKELSGAKLALTLERTVDSVPLGLVDVPTAKDVDTWAKRNEVLMKNHRLANNFVLTSVPLEPKGGKFEARLAVPDPWPGDRLIVRVYGTTGKSEGQAVRVVTIEKDNEP